MTAETTGDGRIADVTGLLEWTEDPFIPGEDRWRTWSGRRRDVVLASVGGTVDDLRDPPVENPWRAFALSVIGEDLLLGVGQGTVDGEYPTREAAQAAAEDAVMAWLDRARLQPARGQAALEAREVDFGEYCGGVQPNQRDLYLDGTQVGRAWVPATVSHKPETKGPWVCTVGDGPGHILTQADSLDVALAGAQAMLDLQRRGAKS